MGFKEEISDEKARQRIADVIDAEIQDAEYSNKPTSGLKHLRDCVRPAFTDTGNIRHFQD